MAIKSEVIEENKEMGGYFPVIMKDTKSNLVVMFTSSHTGFVISGNDTHEVGVFCSNWLNSTSIPEWTAFTGKIVLENE